MKGLYNKRDTVIVVGGLIFYHILLFCLCIFWIDKFLIKTYDSGVFVLLFLFLTITFVCDILLYRVQGFRRFLVRWKADETGIRYTILGIKKWRMDWEDIKVFGTLGYSSPSDRGLIFLSTDSEEKYDLQKCTEITSKRIVFEASPEIWKDISKNMPDIFKNKLLLGMNDRCNTFYRTSISNRIKGRRK